MRRMPHRPASPALPSRAPPCGRGCNEARARLRAKWSALWRRSRRTASRAASASWVASSSPSMQPCSMSTQPLAAYQADRGPCERFRSAGRSAGTVHAGDQRRGEIDQGPRLGGDLQELAGRHAMRRMNGPALAASSGPSECGRLQRESGRGRVGAASPPLKIAMLAHPWEAGGRMLVGPIPRHRCRCPQLCARLRIDRGAAPFLRGLRRRTSGKRAG